MLNYILLIFLFFSLPFQGQANDSTLLQYHQHERAGVDSESPLTVGTEQNFQLSSADAAKEIIYSIVSSVGLKPNFEIREAKIANAAAVSYKGKRFILYDAKFIERIRKATQTDWAAVSILAHEIGHHLNGHTMSGQGNHSQELELEADEFSGFILRQMGASLEDAQKAMKFMSSERESASHPGKIARLAAIEKGYLSANERILAFSEQPKVAIAATYSAEDKAESDIEMNSLAKENIFKEVYFKRMPEHTFFLTRQLKLVMLTEEGPAVLGNISKKNNKLMLTIKGREGEAQSFYVTGSGKLTDEKNRVIGYIKNRA